MGNWITRFAPIGAVVALLGCSEVVEPVILPDLKPDASQQEQFDIELNPLTFKAAQALNNQRYNRLVSRPGKAFSADVIREENISRSQFPPNSGKFTYRLGVGDQVALIQYADAAPSLRTAGAMIDTSAITGGTNSTQPGPVAAPNIISTVGRIGTDGSLLLIGVGRLEAANRDIAQLRDEVRSILIRNGKTPNFQLEIKEFNSQKAYITTDSSSTTTTEENSFVLPITDQGTTLRQLIATAGVSFDEKRLTMVRVQRAGKTYAFSLSDLFSEKAPDVYLRDKDHIFIQNLDYLDGKVFLVGGVRPSIIPVRPEQRQTLADVLFASGGPLATGSAQRSAVYLLRGRDPVQAYHLDAQNPARILVADAVELRPNDIVFVAEQPITTFNRTVATLSPLRALIEDFRGN